MRAVLISPNPFTSQISRDFSRPMNGDDDDAAPMPTWFRFCPRDVDARGRERDLRLISEILFPNPEAYLPDFGNTRSAWAFAPRALADANGVGVRADRCGVLGGDRVGVAASDPFRMPTNSILLRPKLRVHGAKHGIPWPVTRACGEHDL